jgi:putative peptidoglycan lipid II flippase
MATTVTNETVRPPLWRRLLGASLLSERAITLSTIVVAGGFLASKVLGLARVRLTAEAFGTSAAYDAFKVANTFSDMLDSVIAGTTIAAVFIPVFSSFMAGDSRAHQEGWRFASAVLNAMFLLVTLVAGIGIAFAPWLVGAVIAPGFDAPQRALAADLMRIVLFAAIVFGVSGTITGILHAGNRFVLASLASPLNNVGVILAVLWLVPQFGIYGLAYGVVFGSLLHLGIQIPALVRAGMRWSPTLGLGQANVTGGMRELLGLLGPRIVTTNIGSVMRLITNNIASFLIVGSIGALDYAYLLWQFPETLIGTAIAVAVFPRLAQRVAANDRRGFRRLYRIALLTILALAIPATVVAIVLAPAIVSLVLRSGAFDAASAALVARVLQFFALAIVGESVLELTARVFYANKDSKTPMFVALGGLVLRVTLMIVWRDSLGAAGLALAYAIGVCVEAAALWFVSERRFVRNIPD